jgi:hypothetical protein
MSFVWRSISLCGWNLLLLPMSSCQLVTGSYVKLGKALWTIVGEWTLFEIREDYTLESMKSSKISGCVFISFMYCLVEKCLWWNPVSLLKAWSYHIFVWHVDLFPCSLSCNAFIVDFMHALIITNCQGSQNLGLHLGLRGDDTLVDQRHHRSKDLSQICKQNWG